MAIIKKVRGYGVTLQYASEENMPISISGVRIISRRLHMR